MLNALRTVATWLPVLLEAVAFVVSLVELGAAEGDPVTGEEKRAEAIAHLRDLVPVEVLPAFVRDNFDRVAGMVIDFVVGFFNRTGFFTKSSGQ